MTLGHGSSAQRCSGKKHLGLVNTDESAWKMWVKFRRVMLIGFSSDEPGLRERGLGCTGVKKKERSTVAAIEYEQDKNLRFKRTQRQKRKLKYSVCGDRMDKWSPKVGESRNMS